MGYCYCRKPGVHIHHIDLEKTNHDFDNLVMICFEHHDDASVKGGLKRRPNATQIKMMRDQLYLDNDEKRKLELEHYNKQLKTVSPKNLRQAAMDANIIMKWIDLREGFFDEPDWGKRGERLYKFQRYSEYSSLYTKQYAINFAVELSSWTRNDMPWGFAYGIESLILDYFPFSEEEDDRPKVIELCKKCAHAAANIVYDASLYLNDLSVASVGLEILKYVYRQGVELGIREVSDAVLEEYVDLKQHLDRPERNDLTDSKRLLQVFKDDLDKRGLGFPNNIDRDLWEKICVQRDEKKIKSV